MRAPRPLPAESLRWQCDLDTFAVQGTDEIEPAVGIVGQESAVDALRFGLETDAPGQNVFVRGLTGTGRLSLVRQLLEQIQSACPLAPDRCYVFRGSEPERPRLITLPRGQGHPFQQAAERFVNFIRRDLRRALSEGPAREQRRQLEQRHRAQLDELGKPFEAKLREQGLTLVSVNTGEVVVPVIVPLHEGKPLPPETLEELVQQGVFSSAQVDELRDKVEASAEELAEISAKMQRLREGHLREANDLQQGQVRELLGRAASGLRESFAGEDVAAWIDDVIDHAARYAEHVLSEEGAAITALYSVNVLRTCAEQDCPVIVENQPTRDRLVGGIEPRRDVSGEFLPAHMVIGCGSLLRADGGYLILESRDVFSEEGAWPALIRTLRNGVLEIVMGSGRNSHGAPMLRPDPIPVSVKVVLLGDHQTHAALDMADADFPHLFKVVADFDDSVTRDEAGVRLYAGVLARIAKEESLPPFDRGAVAALAEHGARIADEPERLTARFGRVADLAREAAFLCTRDHAGRVLREHVESAVLRTRKRADLPARRFHRQLEAGRLAVRTSGRAVGQANGLAVIHIGHVGYGFPARITASVGPGSGGAVNIEGEAGLSGAIHTKGFYILGGLLRNLLRTRHPLVFDASIAFEQSYGGIDGDSASGVEICCLMSALTELPVRQDLAMTGAIDQLGNVLPIGGVNAKVEGFFDACTTQGRLETHGVLIPKSNVGDLMLAPRVMAAVQQGTFQVYAVERIEQALELLLDREAGERDDAGQLPPDSVLGLAMQRAADFWERLRPEER